MADFENRLENADLAPVPPALRTWRWYHFAALWIGMVIAVPAYMIPASMLEQGLSAAQAVGIVLAGNLVVLVPILLIGHAGSRYGVPFAVLVRTSFGVQGAKLPALARALVACGWYGIQTWIGGSTLLALLSLGSASVNCSPSWCFGWPSCSSSPRALTRSASSRPGPRR
jgi:NCS1 family nucleobase:cation symporter-1